MGPFQCRVSICTIWNHIDRFSSTALVVLVVGYYLLVFSYYLVIILLVIYFTQLKHLSITQKRGILTGKNGKSEKEGTQNQKVFFK